MTSIVKGGRIKGESIPIRLGTIDDIPDEEVLDDSMVFANQEEVNHKKEVNKFQREIGELLAKKQAVIEETKSEASFILQDAKIQANTYAQEMQEKIEKDKKEADIHIGEMKKKAQKEIDVLKKKAKQQIEKEKKQVLVDSEPDIIDLVSDLLDFIISNEIENSGIWLKYLVRKILRQESSIENVKIQISSKVYSITTEDELEEIKTIAKNVTVSERSDLPDYACIIVTDVGEIHYDVSKTLDKVKKDLKLLNKVEEKV
ncbi:MAG: hypothetical protein ATN35_08940 [Epulopiscium sp. Nele67-Bin004]|nr:MAG: hypothetical protein ATN35_08940 [Epulopiscium sp. Nele67-Bin004]